LTAYAILALLCSIFAVIPSISHLFWQAVLLLPAALYIVACVFALFQPLDSQNLDKLVVYRSAEGMSDAVKYSLTDRIVHGKNKTSIRPLFVVNAVFLVLIVAAIIAWGYGLVEYRNVQIFK